MHNLASLISRNILVGREIYRCSILGSTVSKKTYFEHPHCLPPMQVECGTVMRPGRFLRRGETPHDVALTLANSHNSLPFARLRMPHAIELWLLSLWFRIHVWINVYKINSRSCQKHVATVDVATVVVLLATVVVSLATVDVNIDALHTDLFNQNFLLEWE